ncbi:uncharacterized protein LOC132611909 [Lycium barbarum]|uniref:uncharacterized protein LOC132611909 n=1 Tax=Lycium barbarum TaxID=112863 RepID=UPI00293E11BE|nr:uncharacterized protein LOC132611909 [Lycium barbarum]
MSQQGPSKRNKRAQSRTYAKPGSLSSLANKKRQLLTANETVQAIRSEKEDLLELIGKQQPVAPQSDENEQLVEEQQVEEQFEEEQQPVEEQMQMDSTIPPTNEKSKEDVIIEFGSFLGTLARTATLCPFDILDWRKIDTKDDLWTYTKEKYDIPEAGKKWTLKAIHAAWRRHKSDLKKLGYKPKVTDEIIMAKRPSHIPESQFKELLEYWKSEKFQKMSKTNTENRKKLLNPHTVGKKGSALVRNKLEKTKGNVSLKEILWKQEQGNPGACTRSQMKTQLVEMEEIETQLSVDGSQLIDAYSAVMGPEHPGCLRLYGRGVTKTSLKGKAGTFEPTSNATNDVVQEMQERIQKMEEQMEEQKRTMRAEVTADITAKVIETLQRAGLISPDMLVVLCVPSPGEATSAP